MSQKRIAVVASVALGTLMNGLDTTIVSIAKPTIEGDLKDVLLSAWIFTAFTAAAASAGPAWGRLSDFLGRRRLLLTALIGFTLASVGCGLAPTMLTLVLFRAVQGFFGGALYPLANAVVADLYAPEERSRGIAVIQSVNVLAYVTGPALGAFITAHWGWRWNFYVNVPILAIALLMILMNYRPDKPHYEHAKFDYGGMGLFGLAIGLLVIGLGIAGGRKDGWSSPAFPVLLGASLVCVIAFVLRERREPRGFVPLEFLKRGQFATTILCVMFSFATFISIMAFVPAYIQGVCGLPTRTVGNVMSAIVLGWFLMAMSSGMLTPKVGARVLALIGVLLMLGGLVMLNLWTPQSSTSMMFVSLLLLGAGIGFTTPPLFVLGQTSLPKKDQGLASGLLGTSANLGATLGTAAFAAVMAWAINARGGAVLADQIAHLMRPADRQALLQSLGDSGLAAVVTKYAASLHRVFNAELIPPLLTAIILLIGLAVWGRGIRARLTNQDSGADN